MADDLSPGASWWGILRAPICLFYVFVGRENTPGDHELMPRVDDEEVRTENRQEPTRPQSRPSSPLPQVCHATGDAWQFELSDSSSSPSPASTLTPYPFFEPLPDPTSSGEGVSQNELLTDLRRQRSQSLPHLHRVRSYSNLFRVFQSQEAETRSESPLPFYDNMYLSPQTQFRVKNVEVVIRAFFSYAEDGMTLVVARDQLRFVVYHAGNEVMENASTTGVFGHDEGDEV